MERGKGGGGGPPRWGNSKSELPEARLVEVRLLLVRLGVGPARAGDASPSVGRAGTPRARFAGVERRTWNKGPTPMTTVPTRSARKPKPGLTSKVLSPTRMQLLRKLRSALSVVKSDTRPVTTPMVFWQFRSLSALHLRAPAPKTRTKKRRGAPRGAPLEVGRDRRDRRHDGDDRGLDDPLGFVLAVVAVLALGRGPSGVVAVDVFPLGVLDLGAASVHHDATCAARHTSGTIGGHRVAFRKETPKGD